MVPEVRFASTSDLLARYVAEGPGQLMAPLPGPPAPGTFTVGSTLKILISFRDRELRIPVRCRVLAIRTDGAGHWQAQLEFLATGDAKQTLAEASADAPAPEARRLMIRVRATLADGRQLEAKAVALEPQGLKLDRSLPGAAGDIVRLAIRLPGQLWPLRLAGEIEGSAANSVALLFRAPSEELAWTHFLEEVGARRGELLLA